MATSKRIHVNPDWYGPYQIAQAYRVGDLVFMSGQCACGDKGEPLHVGDFTGQVEAAFRNIRTVLRAEGGDLDNIVKLNIFVTDIANMQAYYEVYNKYFGDPWPTGTLIEISRLALPDLLVEIDVIANLGGKRTN